jgi:clan AA aspartic protease (TIGR02281 family)
MLYALRASLLAGFALATPAFAANHHHSNAAVLRGIDSTAWADPAPPPATGSGINGDWVRIAPIGAAEVVDVSFGTQWAVMMIDTGCSSMAIRREFSKMLIEAGEAVASSPTIVSLADGSERAVDTVTIFQVHIGSRIATNVRATVLDDPNAMQLLGMGALGQMGKFSLDIANSKLVFGG